MSNNPTGRDSNRKSIQVAALFCLLLWCGMLLGVSFLATPVKFLAPSLSLSVALDIGRQTFGVFNLFECVLSLLLIGLCLGIRNKPLLGGSILVAIMVFLQRFFLLPALDERVSLFIQGSVPPDSILHSIYILIEVVKTLLLLVLSAVVLHILCEPAHRESRE